MFLDNKYFTVVVEFGVDNKYFAVVVDYVEDTGDIEDIEDINYFVEVEFQL